MPNKLCNLAADQAILGLMAVDAQSFKRQLGQKILTLRKQAGMTQSELAEAAGVGNEYVSKIERGLGTPSLETTLKIAHALQAEIKTLFDFKERLPKPKKRPPARLLAAVETLDARDRDLVYALARRLGGKRRR